MAWITKPLCATALVLAMVASASADTNGNKDRKRLGGTLTGGQIATIIGGIVVIGAMAGGSSNNTN